MKTMELIDMIAGGRNGPVAACARWSRRRSTWSPPTASHDPSRCTRTRWSGTTTRASSRRPLADLDLLERWRASGVDYLSVNVGYDVMTWQETIRTLADFRRRIGLRPDR